MHRREKNHGNAPQCLARGGGDLYCWMRGPALQRKVVSSKGGSVEKRRSTTSRRGLISMQKKKEKKGEDSGGKAPPDVTGGSKMWVRSNRTE